MKHLKKRWRLVSYFTVLFGLVILDLEFIGQFYIAAGFSWLVFYIVRNRDPNYRGDADTSSPQLDFRHPNASYYFYK